MAKSVKSDLIAFLVGQTLLVILLAKGTFTVCKEPLGMQNGLIPDTAVSASSVLSPSNAASKGRLNQDGCWTARYRNRSQWFLVDFGRTVNITQLAAQGGGDVYQWVTRYNLYYRQDGSSRFTRYGDSWLVGNRDSSQRKVHTLNPWITARFILINPRAWYSGISLRVEFYGCRDGCVRALGMEDKRIPDSALSASSSSGSYVPSFARLNLAGYSWNPQRYDNNPWLQVEFGHKVRIVQVATQGEGGWVDYWVESYKLSYFADGQDFVNLNQVFDGNWDRNTIVINVIQPPIITVRVRIYPQKSQDGIIPLGMRTEFYGCRKVSQGNITARALSAESIMVEWQVTGYLKDNSLPCGFVVSYREVGSILFINKTLLASESRLVINKLPAYTWYDVKVMVINDVCSGTFSNAVMVRTQEKAPTAPPTNVTVATVTYSSAVISWQPPEQSERNGKLLYYLIRTWEMSPSSNLTKAPLEVTHDGTSGEQQYVLQGLKASASYILQLTVNNSAGFSPPSVTVSFKTLKAPSIGTTSQEYITTSQEHITTSQEYITTFTTEIGENTTKSVPRKEHRKDESRTLSSRTVIAISVTAAALFIICVIAAVYLLYRKRKTKKGNEVPENIYEMANGVGEDVYTYAVPDGGGTTAAPKQRDDFHEYAEENPLYETSEVIETKPGEQVYDLQGNPPSSSGPQVTSYGVKCEKKPNTVQRNKAENQAHIKQQRLPSNRDTNEPFYDVLEGPEQGSCHGNSTSDNFYAVLENGLTEDENKINSLAGEQSQYDVIWDSNQQTPRVAPAADTSNVYEQLCATSIKPETDHKEDSCYDNIYNTAGDSIA